MVKGAKQSDEAGLLGVALVKRTNGIRFKARINFKGWQLNLGRFLDFHRAALAYDQASVQLRGIESPTNYPIGSYSLDCPEVQRRVDEFKSMLLCKGLAPDLLSKDNKQPGAAAAAAFGDVAVTLAAGPDPPAAAGGPHARLQGPVGGPLPAADNSSFASLSTSSSSSQDTRFSPALSLFDAMGAAPPPAGSPAAYSSLAAAAGAPARPAADQDDDDFLRLLAMIPGEGGGDDDEDARLLQQVLASPAATPAVAEATAALALQHRRGDSSSSLAASLHWSNPVMPEPSFPAADSSINLAYISTVQPVPLPASAQPPSGNNRSCRHNDSPPWSSGSGSEAGTQQLPNPVLLAPDCYVNIGNSSCAITDRPAMVGSQLLQPAMAPAAAPAIFSSSAAIGPDHVGCDAAPLANNSLQFPTHSDAHRAANSISRLRRALQSLYRCVRSASTGEGNVTDWLDKFNQQHPDDLAIISVLATTMQEISTVVGSQLMLTGAAPAVSEPFSSSRFRAASTALRLVEEAEHVMGDLQLQLQALAVSQLQEQLRLQLEQLQGSLVPSTAPHGGSRTSSLASVLYYWMTGLPGVQSAASAGLPVISGSAAHAASGPADGVVVDAAVVRVAQTLAKELLLLASSSQE